MREEMRRKASTEVRLRTPERMDREESSKEQSKEPTAKEESTSSVVEDSSSSEADSSIDVLSDDHDTFKEDYPLLWTLKHEQDDDVILNKILYHKHSLKTALMKPIEKYRRDLDEESEEEKSDIEEGEAGKL